MFRREVYLRGLVLGGVLQTQERLLERFGVSQGASNAEAGDDTTVSTPVPS
jgi:hypothetical protein